MSIFKNIRCLQLFILFMNEIKIQMRKSFNYYFKVVRMVVFFRGNDEKWYFVNNKNVIS